MKPIEVSVIVPVFNCAAYLTDLMDSLCSQSGVSWEMIAVNDGSTDDSLVILQEIAATDTRLVIINQSNQGVAAARNSALAQARGHWVAFVDADDWLAPDTLQTWVQQANRLNVDLLIGNGFRFRIDPHAQHAKQAPLHTTKGCTKDLLYHHPPGQVISGRQWIIHSVKQDEWLHYVWLQFVRRDLIVNNQLAFIHDMVHEDILWTTDLALVAQRIGFCATPFYGYRINPLSITHSHSAQSLYNRANSYVDIIKGFLDRATTTGDDPLLRKALLRHANRESGHFLGLMRKKIASSPEHTELARRFIRLGLRSALFLGATNISDFWRALRCSLTISYYAVANIRATQ
ncbi:glycosyltransferase [Candidatus Fukatsuia endosymbiont of Tuberolachnus salignus]|uniref:glycosyltransferase n=1 Tax=Candidatus Fukatsuia endosymbiont of Tuberolachnus salignus TaxID=3077957 RepID=UPI00313E73D8